MKGRRRKYSKRRVIQMAAVILAATILAVGSHFYKEWQRKDADVSIHFIDVGQGDASLILTDEAAIVIDAGPVSSGDRLTSYIKKYTDNVDCIVISHPHEDHMGGAAELITSFEVSEVIMTSDSTDAAFFSRALDAMVDKDVKVTEAEVGEIYTVKGIKMTVLSPNKDYDDRNNNSIVMRVEADGVSALFTGDAEALAEEDIINVYGSLLRCDILKVGHHGSDTSSTEKFLDAVSPEYAVISCGANNKYGHPKQEIIERLKQRGIEYHRTDIEGDVVMTVENGKIRIK